ncbi:MAG TPA: hypothetical protein VF736_11565 [Pyrinomonadaceae bacterium]|jgi:hypothetical protein
MRSRLTAVALLALLCAAAPARASAPVSDAADAADAQEGRSQIIVPLQSGAFVRIRTESAPPSAGVATSDLVESEDTPNLIRRVFVDRNNGLFFGYELLVERAAEARYFWVTVRALGEEYLRELAARPAFRGRRLHPSYNATAFPASPQFLRDGDTFALDVLHNPRTGVKIVDVVQISLADPRLRRAAADQPPRDFAPEDVQLKVADYRLRVNGEIVHRSTGGCSGALVWFSLGDRGRFVFSLVPRPGHDFRKVGAVRDNAISFEWGGDRYEWESSLPVVGAGGNWNLWVLHDPDYRADLFDQTPPPPGAADDKGFERRAEEAARRVKQQRTQADYGAPSEEPTPRGPRAVRRVRVVIGSADGVEYLFPGQQK